MELITILNRCHRFLGFVYQHAHFSADKKSIEVAVRPREGSAAVRSPCRQPVLTWQVARAGIDPLFCTLLFVGSSVALFEQTSGPVPVRGYLHHPAGGTGDALVLSHGAGSDARSPLLVTVAEAFAASGFHVLRIDLPFRQERSGGSPHPSRAGRDREGIREAVRAVSGLAKGRVFLAGHSYGGRQSSMLAAEDPSIGAGLLLLAYPLHPPGKPEQLRTAHLPNLRIPCVFVHGTKDPFGTPAELQAAIQSIPGTARLIEVPGTGHDLGRGKRYPELWASLPGLVRSGQE